MKLLFQIFSEQNDFELLNSICNAVVKCFPDAICVGGSCNGGIVNGSFSGGAITIACTVFEQESTHLEVLQYVMNEESAKPVAEDLVREVEKRPWVSAVGVLLASKITCFTNFCAGFETLRKDVQVFGGVAGQAGEETPAFVFSNLCGYSDESVVFVLFGGDDLHVETTKISGWKPLGKTFTVTKAMDNVLWELDGRPAFEAYSKYLNIQNDYYFYNNTLEFPLFCHDNGENLLRSPLACSEEGALLLSSNVENGSSTRIAYGDPQSIMESVKAGSIRLSKFCPDVILMSSSLARKTFWGEQEVSKETLPFNTLAPTFGFVATGEFLRSRGALYFHNATIVVAAMREGEVDPARIKTAVVNDGYRAGRVSVISRLANFTNVSSAELMEMYNKMTKNSITDALTGLYNRGEIQRRIAERFAEYPNEKMSLVMIDIDNFKSVNDTFGHKEGDNVIMGLSKQIQMATFETAPDADAGRWGGEEFMIMLPDMGIKEAVEFAEAVRTGFAQVDFPAVGKKTISLGATELHKGDSSDSICVRVDDALYQAKRTGKNKVVVL
ncbi:MAG: diguanylate cyclase [Fibrobacter sp.]|nr:diguanylate cyclase [Fibrobacter sp.]